MAAYRRAAQNARQRVPLRRWLALAGNIQWTRKRMVREQDRGAAGAGAAVAVRAVLKLEIIGDNYRWAARHGVDLSRLPTRRMIDVIRYGRRELRPWVARLVGLDKRFGFKREFITGMRDYSLANGDGSRGVYEYWALPDGLYEINECVKWGQARRRFIRVVGDKMRDISKEEAIAGLTGGKP